MQEETAEELAEEKRTEADTAQKAASESGAAQGEAAQGEAAKEEAGPKTAAENEITETQAPETETAAEGEKDSAQDDSAKRGSFLKCVAGLYLIYTAYELADSYLKQEEGSSLGFCIAGIIFGLIGVFLLYIVVRDYLRNVDNHRQL